MKGGTLQPTGSYVFVLIKGDTKTWTWTHPYFADENGSVKHWTGSHAENYVKPVFMLTTIQQ